MEREIRRIKEKREKHVEQENEYQSTTNKKDDENNQILGIKRRCPEGREEIEVIREKRRVPKEPRMS